MKSKILLLSDVSPITNIRPLDTCYVGNLLLELLLCRTFRLSHSSHDSDHILAVGELLCQRFLFSLPNRHLQRVLRRLYEFVILLRDSGLKLPNPSRVPRASP